MACQNIENYYILKTTASVDCSRETFKLFIGLICVPNIIFVSLIIPIIYALKKFYNAKKNNQRKFQFQLPTIQFRYFILQRFFVTQSGKNLRELLILLEKTLLIFSQEFFSSAIMKLLSLFFILFFFFLVQIIIHQAYKIPQSSIFYLSKAVILINIYFFTVLTLNYNQTLAFVSVSVAAVLKARLYFIFVRFLRKDFDIAKITMISQFKAVIRHPKSFYAPKSKSKLIKAPASKK